VTLCFSAVAIEQVAKNMSTLSKEEKLKVIENDSPELLAFLQDIKNKLEELRKHVAPTLKK
jgi:hypothetical protein